MLSTKLFVRQEIMGPSVLIIRSIIACHHVTLQGGSKYKSKLLILSKYVNKTEKI